MCGSGVLDTVIGVVFAFLLVSLLVTTGNGPASRQSGPTKTPRSLDPDSDDNTTARLSQRQVLPHIDDLLPHLLDSQRQALARDSHLLRPIRNLGLDQYVDAVVIARPRLQWIVGHVLPFAVVEHAGWHGSLPDSVKYPTFDPHASTYYWISFRTRNSHGFDQQEPAGTKSPGPRR